MLIAHLDPLLLPGCMPGAPSTHRCRGNANSQLSVLFLHSARHASTPWRADGRTPPALPPLQVWREGGIVGMYNGFGLKMCRAVPMSAIGFLVYERVFATLRRIRGPLE